jgi:hypothetical protein
LKPGIEGTLPESLTGTERDLSNPHSTDRNDRSENERDYPEYRSHHEEEKYERCEKATTLTLDVRVSRRAVFGERAKNHGKVLLYNRGKYTRGGPVALPVEVPRRSRIRNLVN